MARLTEFPVSEVSANTWQSLLRSAQATPTGLTMKRTGNAAALFLLLGFLSVGFAQAGGGALGIDHILTYDNSGIWKRSDQSALLDLLIGGEIVGQFGKAVRRGLGPIQATRISGSKARVITASPAVRSLRSPRSLRRLFSSTPMTTPPCTRFCCCWLTIRLPA